MSKIVGILSIVCLLTTLSITAFADEDFHGIVTQRPKGIVGTWVIADQPIQATKATKLDTENGPIKVGSCVEVDMDDGIVEEIESELPTKCVP